MPPAVVRAEELAQRLVAMYATIEQRIAAGIAARVAAGGTAPDWAERKLAATREIERWVSDLVASLAGGARDEVARAIISAYRTGGDAALAELATMRKYLPEPARLDEILQLAKLRLTAVESEFPGAHAVNRLVEDLALRLDSVRPAIVRWAVDAYREVIAAGVAPEVLSGVSTRYSAMQRAWGALLDLGIDGFTDVAGRRWSLSGYVEMASRTTVARAALAGRLDQMASNGISLVLVSNHAHECRLCRPWEQQILEMSGPGGRRTIEVTNVITTERQRVEVAGTVDDARREGLFHPNCEHALHAFLPGATTVQGDTADPKGDAARQRQRELERRIRRLKLKADATIDPSESRVAAGRVRQAQADLRAHLDASRHLGLLRRRYRERPDLGFTRR